MNKEWMRNEVWGYRQRNACRSRFNADRKSEALFVEAMKEYSKWRNLHFDINKWQYNVKWGQYMYDAKSKLQSSPTFKNIEVENDSLRLLFLMREVNLTGTMIKRISMMH